MSLVDVLMPANSQEGTESVVANWLKRPGDLVKEHEPLVEISTDKVMMEVASPASGVLVEVLKTENDKIDPGDILGRIDSAESKAAGQGNGAPMPKDTHSAAKSSALQTSSGEDAALSPAVKKLLKDSGIESSRIKGTGPGGRIRVEDVEEYLKGGKGNIPSHKVPHTPIRRSISQHMVQSLLKTAPHVTAVFDCDLSSVVDHRDRNKKNFEAKGVNLTLTSYFVRAMVSALKIVPEVNSRWHDDSLEVFEDFNIGVATALDEGGLIVPVLMKAGELDLLSTAAKLQDLVSRARTNSLSPSEVQSGTITITNHGVSGSLIATPIINQPQSAILGVGKLEKRVVVREKDSRDSIEVRPMAYVTLTIDHRALDGFQANKFLSAFKETIEGWKE